MEIHCDIVTPEGPMFSGEAEMVVVPDRVIVLAENAFEASEINAAEAERQKLAAEKELSSLASHDEEFALAEARLEESIAKIHVATQISH